MPLEHIDLRSPKAACQRKPTAPLALSSTERLHKKPFACLPTALRPSGPVQQWIFHQAEKEFTTLPGLRYSSGHIKGRFQILIHFSAYIDFHVRGHVRYFAQPMSAIGARKKVRSAASDR